MTQEEVYHVCYRCNGSGRDPEDIYSKCKACWATGKLDWIENILGRKEKPTLSFEEEAVENMTIELSKQIDKDILEALKTGCSSSIYGGIDDNGNVLKFLLQRGSKRHVKDQEE